MDFRCISSFLNSGNNGDSADEDISTSGQTGDKSHMPVCTSCKNTIYDNWLLGVDDFRYHMSCLRCCVCLRTLYAHASCFIRDSDVYCREHYINIYATKCSGCGDVLQRSDWVQRARDMVFHLDCFCCHACGSKLSEGDMFTIKGGLIVCKDHFEETTDVNMNVIDDADNVSVSSVDSDCRSEVSEISVPDERGAGGKRIRSKFTTSDLKVLQETFRRKPVLTPEELEGVAEEIGHTKKVVMIWFQNARARKKKLLFRKVPSPSCTTRAPAAASQWSRDPCSPAEDIS